MIIWEILITYTDADFVGNLVERMSQPKETIVHWTTDTLEQCNAAMKTVVSKSAEAGWDIILKSIDHRDGSYNANLTNGTHDAYIECKSIDDGTIQHEW